MWQMSTQRTAPQCEWCHKEIASVGRGRPRKFCSQSCRQRSYEQRNAVKGTSISPDAVILSPERADGLWDDLFELRCAAEDIATAVSEGAGADEVQALCAELVSLSTRIEQLRNA